MRRTPSPPRREGFVVVVRVIDTSRASAYALGMTTLQVRTQRTRIPTTLKTARKAQKVSIIELSRRTGLSRQTLYDAENGWSVTLRSARWIANALEMSVDDLWPNFEEPPKKQR